MNRLKPIALFAIACAMATAVVAQAPLDRTVLPIPEPDYPHSTVLDGGREGAPMIWGSSGRRLKDLRVREEGLR